MIFPNLFLTKMCCPDGFKTREESGEGILLRVNIITQDELTQNVNDYLDKNHSNDTISEWWDQEIMEWVEPDELDEHDGEYYDAYCAYSHGEAESAIVVQITEDYMKSAGIPRDFEIHVKIDYIIQEKFDILDH